MSLLGWLAKYGHQQMNVLTTYPLSDLNDLAGEISNIMQDEKDQFDRDREGFDG